MFFGFLNFLPNLFTSKNNKKEYSTMNTFTLCDYYDRLKLIALSMFEWEGLPDSCNARYIEKVLFDEGRLIFINDAELGFMAMRCNDSGVYNTYDEATKYTAYGVNYTPHTFNLNECVVIRNNILERPTSTTVSLFAGRLANIERTIDVNINAQKTPILISCDEKDRLTLKNMYEQYEGNTPFIFATKAITNESITAIKTDAPFIADKLQEHKRQIWNEVLTFFGINNANSDKRERLITDEVNSNNEVIQFNADAFLQTRKEACAQINKMFGLNVSVKKKEINSKELGIDLEGGEE